MGLDALRYGGVVVYPLLALGVLALALMLEKAYVHALFVRLPRLDVETLPWEELERRVAALPPAHRTGHFLRVLLAGRGKPVWWLESRAGDAAREVDASLGRGLWLLETVVTAAPLLGLLGTITGMMQAFRLIGAHGLVDPTGVTSGVAEALVATALGLLIALVSLFGFNYFARLQAGAMDTLERLGTRLVDRMRLEAE